MNTLRKWTIVTVLVAALAVFALPAFAQDDAYTVTITEDEINDSYRVANPFWRSVTGVSVDLQPDQVVVDATVTFRRHGPYAVSVTLTPSISNGRIFWSASTASVDGQTVSDDLLRQINAHIEASWHRYIRMHLRPGRVTGIDISDSEIVITLAA